MFMLEKCGAASADPLHVFWSRPRCTECNGLINNKNSGHDTTLDTHLRTWQEGHIPPEDCHSHTHTHTDYTDYWEVSGSSPLQMFDAYLKKTIKIKVKKKRF